METLKNISTNIQLIKYMLTGTWLVLIVAACGSGSNSSIITITSPAGTPLTQTQLRDLTKSAHTAGLAQTYSTYLYDDLTRILTSSLVKGSGSNYVPNPTFAAAVPGLLPRCTSGSYTVSHNVSAAYPRQAGDWLSLTYKDCVSNGRALNGILKATYISYNLATAQTKAREAFLFSTEGPLTVTIDGITANFTNLKLTGVVNAHYSLLTPGTNYPWIDETSFAGDFTATLSTTPSNLNYSHILPAGTQIVVTNATRKDILYYTYNPQQSHYKISNDFTVNDGVRSYTVKTITPKTSPQVPTNWTVSPAVSNGVVSVSGYAGVNLNIEVSIDGYLSAITGINANGIAITPFTAPLSLVFIY